MHRLLRAVTAGGVHRAFAGGGRWRKLLIYVSCRRLSLGPEGLAAALVSGPPAVLRGLAWVLSSCLCGGRWQGLCWGHKACGAALTPAGNVIPEPRTGHYRHPVVGMGIARPQQSAAHLETLPSSGGDFPAPRKAAPQRASPSTFSPRAGDSGGTLDPDSAPVPCHMLPFQSP